MPQRCHFPEKSSGIRAVGSQDLATPRLVPGSSSALRLIAARLIQPLLSEDPTRDSGCPAEPGFSIPGHFKCCGLSPTPACQNLRFVTSNQLISLGFYFCQLYNGDNHPISWGFLGTNERSNASSLLITQIIINVQSITLRKTKAYFPATCDTPPPPHIPVKAAVSLSPRAGPRCSPLQNTMPSPRTGL